MSGSEPLTLGVGPAGSYVASRPDGRRDALREQCRRLLPAGPGQPGQVGLGYRAQTKWGEARRRSDNGQ